MAILYTSNGQTFSPLKIDLSGINAIAFPPIEHNHDDLYNTKSQVDAKINNILNTELPKKVDKTITLTSGIDLNTVLTSGFYRINTATITNGFPNANYSQMIVSRGADTIVQIGWAYGNKKMYYRTGTTTGGTYGFINDSWHEVAIDMPAWTKKASLQLSDMPAIPQSKITGLTNDLSSKASITYVDTKVASLVDSAPETLDTLNELALALGEDPNFAANIANRIGEKLKKVDFYNGSVMKKELMPSLDTTDIPALAASHITSGTFAVARIPSLAITKITNLEPTLAGKANLASPTFTGNPTATTPPEGNDSKRLATTAFVQRDATNIVNAKMDNKSIKVLTQAQYNSLGSSRDLANTIYFIT